LNKKMFIYYLLFLMSNLIGLDLVGKNLLITGGAGRIGFATAKVALAKGASVVLADISNKRLADVSLKIPLEFKKQVHMLTADVTTELGISNLIAEAVSAVGPITSAVHSAYPVSEGWGSTFEELKAPFLHEDLANQLGSAILFSKHILHHFQSNAGGDLVHISSIQGICAPKFEHYSGTAMNSPIEYSAIKAGVISITRWLAKYYSGQNIRVNCVSPGGIVDGQPADFTRRYRSSCTNIGMLSGIQVASVIAYLLSPVSEAINGQNLIVDDGWSL